MLTTVQGQLWQIISGSRYCQIVDGGRCVTDGSGDYRNNEYCEVQALQSLIMTTEQYDVEPIHDFVTVKGIKYKQDNRYNEGVGPSNVVIQECDKWTWLSDSSTYKRGFKICGR